MWVVAVFRWIGGVCDQHSICRGSVDTDLELKATVSATISVPPIATTFSALPTDGLKGPQDGTEDRTATPGSTIPEYNTPTRPPPEYPESYHPVPWTSHPRAPTLLVPSACTPSRAPVDQLPFHQGVRERPRQGQHGVEEELVLLRRSRRRRDPRAHHPRWARRDGAKNEGQNYLVR